MKTYILGKYHSVDSQNQVAPAPAGPAFVKFREPYDPSVWAKAEEKLRKKKNQTPVQSAAALGLQLVSPPMT